MGSEPELHERLRVGQSCEGEAVSLLVAPHSLARLIVPPARWLLPEFARADERALDLLDALGLEVQRCEAASLTRPTATAAGFHTIRL